MNIRTMTPGDEFRAIDTIALAFAADPVTRLVWPSAHEYLSVMQSFVRAFGGAAFSNDGAFCSDQYAGAALWLAPGVHPDEAKLGELMETTASPAAREAGPAIFEQMATYHPKEPHWYLPLIGVDPAHQGRGHGDALMRYALARFDRERLPAYLESTNRRNISLYRRGGVECVERSARLRVLRSNQRVIARSDDIVGPEPVQLAHDLHRSRNSPHEFVHILRLDPVVTQTRVHGLLPRCYHTVPNRLVEAVSRTIS